MLRAAPAILLLLLLMLAFEHLGVLHTLEPIVMDARMRMGKPLQESQVAIVSITDQDYRKLFAGTSPLSRAELGRLIDAVAAGKPAVIGVDIDTSARQFKKLALGTGGPRIVWEREVHEIPGNASASAGKLEDVLGGKTDLDPTRNSLGLGLLVDDSEDGVTRRYRRMIPTSSGDTPSFPWAIVKAYWEAIPKQRKDLQESTDDRLIDYSGSLNPPSRIKLTAAQVLEFTPHWKTGSPIANKIVLIGGSYLDQDLHETPLGRKRGVEVMANVIETDLHCHGGLRAPGKATVIALEVFEGFVLILVFHALPVRRALLASLALVPAVSILCSLISYKTWKQPWPFAPVLVGLIIFELYEHFRRSAVPNLWKLVSGRDHPTAGQ